jgi:hypothetical protein
VIAKWVGGQVDRGSVTGGGGVTVIIAFRPAVQSFPLSSVGVFHEVKWPERDANDAKDQAVLDYTSGVLCVSVARSSIAFIFFVSSIPLEKISFPFEL